MVPPPAPNLPRSLIFFRPEPAFYEAVDVIWDLAALLAISEAPAMSYCIPILKLPVCRSRVTISAVDSCKFSRFSMTSS